MGTGHLMQVSCGPEEASASSVENGRGRASQRSLPQLLNSAKVTLKALGSQKGPAPFLHLAPWVLSQSFSCLAGK